ncbi:MAG TPA: rod shape-determining protein MreC [bacterium]|nr:rod shape-determining protein MreC [bacterium]
MRRVLYFISSNKRTVTLFITLFLSISMMFMGKGPKERFARVVTTSIFNTGHFTFSWGIYMLDLWRENKRLRLQNLEYSYKIHSYYLAEKENQNLRRMLGFKEKKPFSVIPANVIGLDVDRIVNSMILDVGEKDGVKKYMAVVTAEGLVGRIYEVFPTSSSVQIIRDVNSKISAMVEGDRSIKGIIRWEGGPYLRMYGLQHLNKPQPGQKVYSTGVGGTVPGGLFIGTVVDQKVDDVNIYASVNVKPAVDFSLVHEIFILKGSERSDIWDDGDGTGHFERPEIQ